MRTIVTLFTGALSLLSLFVGVGTAKARLPMQAIDSAVSLTPTPLAEEAKAFQGEVPSTEERKQLLEIWDAPQICISPAELWDKVRAQLPHDLANPRTVRGVAARSSEGWVVTFTVFQDGQRLGERVLELEGIDCRSHDEALALVAALLLEHGPPVDAAAEPPRAAAPSTPEERKTDQPPEVRQSAPTEHKPLARLRIAAGFRILGGLMPAPALGPTVGVGMTFHRIFLLELEGDYYAAQTLEHDAGATVRMNGGRIHARGCAGTGRRIAGHICAGAGWLGLSGGGQNVEESQRVLFGTGEAGIDAGLVWKLSQAVSLTLDGNLLLPFRTGVFGFEVNGDFVQVHETSRVLWGSALGLALTF